MTFSLGKWLHSGHLAIAQTFILSVLLDWKHQKERGRDGAQLELTSLDCHPLKLLQACWQLTGLSRDIWPAHTGRQLHCLQGASPSLPCDWHTDRYKVCPVPQTVLPFCVHFRDHLPHPPYNLPEPILCPFPSLFSLTPFGEETPRHMHYSPCGALLWGNCSKIKGFLGNFQKGTWIRQYLDYENFRSIQRGFCFLCYWQLCVFLSLFKLNEPIKRDFYRR